MHFDKKELRQLLIRIKNSNLKSISIHKKDDFELIINQEITQNINYITPNSRSIGLSNSIHSKKQNVIKNKLSNKLIEKESLNTELFHTIVSPMVGTFYRSPAPSEPSFVHIHDTVEAKQTICIIEAMKLMNEIEAEIQGDIAAILVEDGDIVDCGQALMQIKPIK